ncbi:MAG: hypothetical protein ABJA32_06255 [Ginsengibacter sp.]|jgi:predicted polyphosphate/ATP-dependent NAD kinase
MSLKKIIPVLLISMCVSLFSPVFAAVTPNATSETPKEVLANKIETRLVEIRNMDKTNMTSVEKKELRKEVKELKKQAKSNGIYLSIGAVIIIILLLILLL